MPTPRPSPPAGPTSLPEPAALCAPLSALSSAPSPAPSPDPARAPRWATADELRRQLAGFTPLALPTGGRRRAAVAVTLTQAGHGGALAGLPQHPAWSEAPALLLTRRAATLRSHAGQWALPGGRIDGDETPEAAALRELAEEVGVLRGPEQVLGRLDDYATHSGYVITPVVVWAGAAREATPNEAEVASIHRIPLSELERPDAPILNHIRGAEHPVLRMPVGQQWIAAPSAAFLYQFREWCLRGLPTRVAHLDQPYFARR